MNLEDIRREYLMGGLTRADLHENPIAQFEVWLEQAIKSNLPDPTAMTLATVNSQGQPSQRIVLLKHLDERGFVFFTNYNSAKAKDIHDQERVSVHFPWYMMERQVAVQGKAEKISLAETVKYFTSRPRDSQLAAWASQQSSTIDSRKSLLIQFESMKAKFANGNVPVPDFWGGYRIVPHTMEFWQGGGGRLHDRFKFTCGDSGQWDLVQLAP